MRSLRRGFLSLALLWAACGTGPEFSTTRAQFLVTACESSDVPQGQQFRIQLHDSVQIVRAMTALQRPDSAAHMVVGRLAHGDGGFNAPWHWHLYPDSTWIADGAVEICDGCPSQVEGGWGFQLGSFCPWTSHLVRRDW